VNLSGLLPLIDDQPAFQALRDYMKQPAGDTPPEGASAAWDLAAGRAYLLAALQREAPRPLVLIAANPERATQLHDQLCQWSVAPEQVHLFPAPEALLYDKTIWGAETINRRIALLSWLARPDLYPEMAASQPAPIIVTSVAALLHKSIAPSYLLKSIRELRLRQRIDLNELLTTLLRLGYQPTSAVEAPGSFSRRGGILDIFAPGQRYPVRIELFGDEIDSLRTFDPETQRSQETVERAAICPATEALPSYGRLALARLKRTDVAQLQALARQRWQQDMENLEFEQGFRGIEFYLPYLYSEPGSLLSFLSRAAAIVTEGRGELANTAATLIEQAGVTRAELVDEGGLPEGYPTPYFTWPALEAALRGRPTLDMAHRQAEEEGANLLGPADSYGGQLAELAEDCKSWRAGPQRIVMVSRQAQRLDDLLRNEGLYPIVAEDVVETPPPGSLTIVQGGMAQGWVLRDRELADALVVLTDSEIFGWAKYRRPRKVTRRAFSPEAFFADLREGDHVVHLEHGIAVYRGLQRKTVDGVEREYLELEYAEGDRLWVPVNQADRITRYVGTGEEPALHRLGTADWDRVKSRAKRAVEDIAQELLQLYAAREVVPGYAFSQDTAWQEEMETSFPYEETEDQLRAIHEVKDDMEKKRPMDRLVCGDVGYGKTEVALRAAFKSVMDGKQVAILVPTTVLAQQHYITFRDRLQAFPVTVEMLSRFRTRAEQGQILDRLATGQVDIVVGTHRLIQKDVEFKDLGLLIIDEEQRFGVAHKERLKQLRSQVDVLTLTATPIPRTLYMALTAARDMSIIDTPPEERLPIRTQVAEMSDSLVRKAILREMGRGGQVYFVHNRVQGIRQIAQHLNRIVPEARLIIGHGQMDEHELSRVMLDFMEGKYDVLLCTTIIESGLDIPSVNTIIINQADKFGLAQLYQLRGRVGRSSAQAYAYLLHNKGQTLSDIAKSRLETILEANELGAGYRVAMRDLELRGAGEILGARQHGQIAAVGFELYTRLLSQAVKKLQRQQGIVQPEARLPFTSLSPTDSASVDLPLSAHLPEDYVVDVPLRLKLYQRMTNLNAIQEIDDVAQELADRFGPLPEPTSNLIYLLRLKVLATLAGASSVARDDTRVVVRFATPEEMTPVRPELIRQFGNVAIIRANQVSLPWGRGGELSRQTLLHLLEAMAQAKAAWEGPKR